MTIEEYTEFLVKSICPLDDLIKVSMFSEDDHKIITIAVPESNMGNVLGSYGKNIKAIRTLVNVYSYLNHVGHVEIQVESF